MNNVYCHCILIQYSHWKTDTKGERESRMKKLSEVSVLFLLMLLNYRYCLGDKNIQPIQNRRHLFSVELVSMG